MKLFPLFFLFIVALLFEHAAAEGVLDKTSKQNILLPF